MKVISNAEYDEFVDSKLEIARQKDQLEKVIMVVLTFCFNVKLSPELTVNLLKETLDDDTFDLALEVIKKYLGY